jgi:hypothetical protein
MAEARECAFEREFLGPPSKPGGLGSFCRIDAPDRIRRVNSKLQNEAKPWGQVGSRRSFADLIPTDLSDLNRIYLGSASSGPLDLFPNDAKRPCRNVEKIAGDRDYATAVGVAAILLGLMII